MKIAQIPGGLIPFSPKLLSSPNSVTNISYLLSEELVRRGYDVTVFAPTNSKTSAKIASGWIPSTDKRLNINNKKGYELFKKYCENVVKQSHKFDLIHVHDPAIDRFWGLFEFSKNIKTPIIATFHNPKFYDENKKRLSEIMFVGISQKQIENNPGFNFIGKVYNGTPLQFYPFNKKPQDYLFWLGRISPEKGTIEAIKVAKKTKKNLFIAGYFHPDHKDYMEKIKKEIKENKNIKFLGFLSTKEKIKYLKNAYCFLAPIKWEEPFGLVMIEAMACGTPVIAFNRGSVPEIVKDGKTGFVVKNTKEMVGAIKKIETIDRKKCRERVEKNFTVEKMADGYEKIYREVIKKYKKKI